MATAPKKTTSKRTTSTKSRSRATTARKTRTSLKAIAEAAPTSEDAEVAAEALDADATPEVTGDAGDADLLRKKELLEAVVARAGVKKRDAKPAIEAALAILGETLAAGREVNIPELGKVKVQNSKDLDEVRVINLRLRRKIGGAATTGEETEDEGLAEPAE